MKLFNMYLVCSMSGYLMGFYNDTTDMVGKGIAVNAVRLKFNKVFHIPITSS